MTPAPDRATSGRWKFNGSTSAVTVRAIIGISIIVCSTVLSLAHEIEGSTALGVWLGVAGANGLAVVGRGA